MIVDMAFELQVDDEGLSRVQSAWTEDESDSSVIVSECHPRLGSGLPGVDVVVRAVMVAIRRPYSSASAVLDCRCCPWMRMSVGAARPERQVDELGEVDAPEHRTGTFWRAVSLKEDETHGCKSCNEPVGDTERDGPVRLEAETRVEHLGRCSRRVTGDDVDGVPMWSDSDLSYTESRTQRYETDVRGRHARSLAGSFEHGAGVEERRC